MTVCRGCIPAGWIRFCPRCTRIQAQIGDQGLGHVVAAEFASLAVSSTHPGVLKKSVTEIVNVGDQAGLVCLHNQQATSQ